MRLEYFFFFQAEDGIRDKLVTGVQTCALPISLRPSGDATCSWLVATDQGIKNASSVAPKLLMSGDPFSRIYFAIAGSLKGVFDAEGDAHVPTVAARPYRVLPPQGGISD